MINVSAIGRIAKEVDLRYTPTGKAVATFNLICERKHYNKDTGKNEIANVRCVIWNKPAEALAKNAPVGMLLGVTGELQTRNYDNQQGEKQYVTELLVENFEFLETKETINRREKKKREAANGNGQQSQNQEPQNNQSQQPF